MAKKLDGLSNEQKEIVKAQNDALLMLPPDRDAYLAKIHGYRLALARENDQIAAARRDNDSAGILRGLQKNHGFTPEALKIIKILDKCDHIVGARTARQVIHHITLKNIVIPDLFDEGAVGVGSNDAAGETGGFDKTSEGRRRGGSKAEPRSTEEMAASHEPKPTPGISLEEAERQLIAYNEANPPKRGPVPKERKRLEAQVEEAKSAAADPTPANDDTQIEEQPEAAPGEVTAGIKEDVAKSEAFLKEQIAERSPDLAVEKAKRGARKAKDKPAAEAAPPAPPADEEPPAPPPEDDEDEDDGPMAAHPAQRAVGDQPSSYGIR